MEPQKDVKKPINVGVPADTHGAMAVYCDARSLIMRDTVGRVLAWFLDQPKPVQRVILGDIDGEVAGAYADILEEMAERLRGGVVTGQPGQGADEKPPVPPQQAKKPIQKAEPKR